MGWIIYFVFASLIAAFSFTASAETFERIELDKDRTSVQYAGPIKSITKALEGYRWLGQTEDIKVARITQDAITGVVKTGDFVWHVIPPQLQNAQKCTVYPWRPQPRQA